MDLQGRIAELEAKLQALSLEAWIKNRGGRVWTVNGGDVRVKMPDMGRGISVSYKTWQELERLHRQGSLTNFGQAALCHAFCIPRVKQDERPERVLISRSVSLGG